MSSVFGGGYEAEHAIAGGPPTLAEQAKASGRPDGEVLALVALGRMERELRRIRLLSGEVGRQFCQEDGGTANASNIFVQRFEGPKSGNDWYVERVTVSVAGAAAAATVGLYRGPVVSGGLPLEADLVDFLPNLFGNTPSRGVLDGKGTPYFVYGGNGVTVVVNAAVASVPVVVNLQGREVAAGSDPALRGQLQDIDRL